MADGAGEKRPWLTRLSLAKPVAQPVRRDNVEHFPRDAIALLRLELRKFFCQTMRLELREQRVETFHMERTTVLRRIAAVFRQSDLNLVASQHGRLMRRVGSRQHMEAEHRFVERHGCREVAHWEVHVVSLVPE